VSERPQPKITPPGATVEEAAAMIAAVEQFLRDTAPPPVPQIDARPSAWKQAALAEGVLRRPDLPL
jgi:hypothetical protein